MVPDAATGGGKCLHYKKTILLYYNKIIMIMDENIIESKEKMNHPGCFKKSAFRPAYGPFSLYVH